jgi:hypothetical protein
VVEISFLGHKASFSQCPVASKPSQARAVHGRNPYVV